MQQPRSPAVERAMRPPHERVLTLAAVLWVLVLGAAAVVPSEHPSGHDAVFPGVFGARTALMRRDGQQLYQSFVATEYHPPLPIVLSTLWTYVAGLSREVVRMGGVLLHVLLLLQVRSLVLALTSCRTSALAGVWLAATSPTITGWFRVDFPDPLVGVLMLAAFQAALRTDLRRTRGAALLGVAVGIGALSKLAFVLFMLGPALVYLAATVRTRRQAANAVVALAVTLVAGGWWYAVNLEDILVNYRMSTTAPWELMGRVELYLLDEPWNIVWTVAALASAAAALLWGAAPRLGVWLLLICLAGGYLLLLVFDAQERYAVPLHPVACVLVAVGLAALLRHRSPAAHRRALMAVVCGLLALPGRANLERADQDPDDTSMRLGLLRRDGREFGAFRRADAWIRARARSYVTVYRDRGAAIFTSDQQVAVLRLGQSVSITEVTALLAHPAARRHVLEVRRTARDAPPSSPYRSRAGRLVAAWFGRQVKVHERTFRDDSPFSFTVYRIPNPTWAGVPARWEEIDDRLEVIRIQQAEPME